MAGSTHRHRAAREALRASVLDAPGRLTPTVRLAAHDGSPLEEPLAAFVAKVRRDAARITDADIASLRTAGLDEDEIFEVTLAAAVGAATEILQAGLDLLAGGDPDAA